MKTPESLVNLVSKLKLETVDTESYTPLKANPPVKGNPAVKGKPAVKGNPPLKATRH